MSRSVQIMIAVLIICLFAGCGEESTQVRHVDRPSVTQTSPQDGATDVNLNPLIQVWFDEALDEASIDSAAFHVMGANTHHIDYDDGEQVITLHLRNILEPDSTYQVVATSAIKNAAGAGMLADHVFGFTTGSLDCGHLEDYLEPNDDIQSAAQVEIGKTYTCLSSCGQDERNDYYAFSLQDAGKVTVSTTPSYVDTERVSWKINFMRGESEYYSTLGTSLASDMSVRSDHFTFLPGTYFVEIGKYYADHHAAVYDLMIETSAPCEDDVYEDNDFMDEAVFVNPGSLQDLRGCSEDRDFFYTRVNTGQTLTVTATTVEPAYSIRRLCIYKPSGTAVACTTLSTEGVPISRSWTATEDTTYFFKVRWWSDGIRYDLDVDVSD